MKNTIKLIRVKYLPNKLDEGILYFSKKYGIAGHLCPCGCKNKIITPIDPFEWRLTIKKGRPSLYPSIGNWQLDCKSHYWITKGRIEWDRQWSEEQITNGYEIEEEKRKLYFEKLNNKNKFWSYFINIFR